MAKIVSAKIWVNKNGKLVLDNFWHCGSLPSSKIPKPTNRIGDEDTWLHFRHKFSGAKVFYKNQLTQKADTILAERLGVFYKKQVMQRAFE